MMESVLGRTEHQEAVAETAKSSLRAEVAKRIALGGGWSVGAAIVFGAYELLHSNPNQAYPLLRSWGPWAVFALVALYVVYDLIKMVLGIAKRGVIAMEHTAVALQRIGDKDDRQLQELQTLTAYTSQQTERQSAVMREVRDEMGEVKTMLGQLLAGRSDK